MRSRSSLDGWWWARNSRRNSTVGGNRQTVCQTSDFSTQNSILPFSRSTLDASIPKEMQHFQPLPDRPRCLPLGKVEIPEAGHHRSGHIFNRDVQPPSRAELVKAGVETPERTPAVEAGLVPHRLAPGQEGVAGVLIGGHRSRVPADQPRHLGGDSPDPCLAEAGLALQMSLERPTRQNGLGLPLVSGLGGALDLRAGLVKEPARSGSH